MSETVNHMNKLEVIDFISTEIQHLLDDNNRSIEVCINNIDKVVNKEVNEFDRGHLGMIMIKGVHIDENCFDYDERYTIIAKLALEYMILIHSFKM